MTLPHGQPLLNALEHRFGALYVRQRIGIERDHEAQVFGYGLNFFHPENWYAMPFLLSAALKVIGLYRRGQRNAGNVQLKRNCILVPRLPPAFDGFTILHLTDLHADMNVSAMSRVKELLPTLQYDICVLTGDYRARTAGDYDACLGVIASIQQLILCDMYGVLGNHDTILMVPELERMGIRMLLNEAVQIRRGADHISLVGVDDAHFFCVDNIEKAASHISSDEFSILLSHTPEIYRQAAHSGFDVMLSGHTHGGQICLPGSIPVTLDSKLPRAMGSGAWRYGEMFGYTSVGAGTSIVPVRFNCPPEITLHELRRN